MTATCAPRIVPGGGRVACGVDRGPRALAAAAAGLPIRVRTYGEADDAGYRITAVHPRGMSVSLDVSAAPQTGSGVRPPVRLEVGVPGRHNALNATAAYAAALELGLPAGQVASGLAAYRGARRRMEPKGEAGGVLVLDSYAHHPTELAADLHQDGAEAVAAHPAQRGDGRLDVLARDAGAHVQHEPRGGGAGGRGPPPRNRISVDLPHLPCPSTPPIPRPTPHRPC